MKSVSSFFFSGQLLSRCHGKPGTKKARRVGCIRRSLCNDGVFKFLKQNGDSKGVRKRREWEGGRKSRPPPYPS